MVTTEQIVNEFESDLITILEAFRIALEFDDIVAICAEQMDLDDSEIERLQRRVEYFMNSEH